MAAVQVMGPKWVANITLKSELQLFVEIGVERIRDDVRSVINNAEIPRPGERVRLPKNELPESIKKISGDAPVEVSNRVLRYVTGGYGSVRMGYIIARRSPPTMKCLPQ